MPETETVFFADDDGTAPLFEWLDRQDRKVQDKCLVKVERLRELGYEQGGYRWLRRKPRCRGNSSQ